MVNMQKLLLVEDDRNIAGALAVALRGDYDVTVATTGKSAIYKNDAEDFAIIVLDLNLPDISGLSVCEQLRNRGVVAPIFMLTAEHKTLSKITALDAGANDYLTKPFSLGEFKARLRALVRAGQLAAAPPKPRLAASGILLDRRSRSVSRDGVAIALRRKEFALLECLLENAGQVVTRPMLTRHAWHGSGELWTNTVDVHITHLRRKIDKPFGTKLIKTVHGHGYKLVDVVTSAGK
jgi:DNA-binding response OmpR family regulator